MLRSSKTVQRCCCCRCCCSDDDIDCSSVNSADIDVAISADEDYATLTPTPPVSSSSPGVSSSGGSPLGGATSTAVAASSGRRHVAFSTVQPFERGSAARATLPAFSSSGDHPYATSSLLRRPKATGDQLLHVTSPSQQHVDMTTKQRAMGDIPRCLPISSANQRPRSKSVGRTGNGSMVATAPVGTQAVAVSTPNSKTATGHLTSADVEETAQGERLSNYRKNSGLRFSGGSSSNPTGNAGQPVVAAGTHEGVVTSADYGATDSTGSNGRWSRSTGLPAASGRRSVDSVTQKNWEWAQSITSSSTTIRDGGQEDLVEGEMVHHDGQSGIAGRCRGVVGGPGGGYFSSQRRGGNYVTSVSPYATVGDPTVGIVAGVRTRMKPSGGRAAMSDVEGSDSTYVTPSRLSGPYSSGLGGRSLPRNGLSWTSGDPVASLMADHPVVGAKMAPGGLPASSGRRPSYGGPAGGTLYGGCNGLLSHHMSASNENLRKCVLIRSV